MNNLNTPLDELITALRRLPGVGRRAAERMALHALMQRESVLAPLQSALTHAAAAMHNCAQCGNLDTASPCHICADESRSKNLLCIVPHIADLWAMERAGGMRLRYHVLGGVMSAVHGVGPDDLRIAALIERLSAPDHEISEIILAFPASVEGQSTAHHIHALIARAAPNVRCTRLAQGVPVGGSLEMMDAGTLGIALQNRVAVAA